MAALVMKAVLRFSTMEDGEPFATIDGRFAMLKWCAINLPTYPDCFVFFALVQMNDADIAIKNVPPEL